MRFLITSNLREVMLFRVLFFSAVLCFAGVCCAPAMAVSSPDALEVTDTEETDEITDTGEEENNRDEEIEEIRNEINSYGWCPAGGYSTNNNYESDIEPDDNEDNETQINRGSDDERRRKLCEQLNEIDSLESELAANTKELTENYQNMKDKETSLENRVLGAAGIGTVGIGGMMAASALSEQNADKAAEADMQTYLSTFSCTYPGGTAKGGQMGIELGGANQLINLYTQYAELANDLKERKAALGLKAGIESEIIIDKATTGLYDDVGTGIGSGAYASIARALRDPDGEDAKKWKEQKDSASKQLKIGAGVAAAGAVATAVANYAINHNNKDRSAELLAKRADIKESFSSLTQELIDECNKTIQEHKKYVAELKTQHSDIEAGSELDQYIKDVEAAPTVKTLSDLYGSLFCE